MPKFATEPLRFRIARLNCAKSLVQSVAEVDSFGVHGHHIGLSWLLDAQLCHVGCPVHQRANLTFAHCELQVGEDFDDTNGAVLELMLIAYAALPCP